MTGDLWFLLLSGVWTGVVTFLAYWTGVAVGRALAPGARELEGRERRAVSRQRARQLAATGGPRHYSGRSR